ncbi:hypothetical protein AC578_8465 [Pseudocercospora eumusae]|uniref:Cas1p 10 TM acyl transferase domain-containing protein n=1 Tax=Pseudocercospora eumusae TaxID=321146 RepID=A0A139GXI5_9PEZI|nr:hypothetical protein AC578_8465 [Pseudocercospora eumusae]
MALDVPKKAPASANIFETLPGTRRLAHCFLVSLLAALVLKHIAFDSDPYKCQAVAKSGLWYENPPVGKGGKVWLTPGCSNIFHGAGELYACAKESERKFVFAGDLQLKSVFWHIAQRLEKDLKLNFDEQDDHFKKDNITLEFVWDPRLNGSTISRIQAFRDGATGRPSLLVIGAGNHAIKHDLIDEYALTAKGLAAMAYESTPHRPIGETISNLDGPGDLLLFAPTTIPYNNEAENRYSVTAHRKLNEKLAELDDQGILDVMWSFDSLSNGRKDMFTDDGLSTTGEVARRRADLLLNLRCNARIANRGNFPHLVTCCAQWRSPNWIQSTLLLMGFVLLPAITAIDYKLLILSEMSRPVVRGFAAFTAGISIQYLADRTHVFEQVARMDLVGSNLRSMIVVTIIIGAVMIRRSKSSRKASPGEKEQDQPFLPRDQTDEWKGWMQAMIIIYHYNKGWENDEFWSVIRLCVAAYLFLTGFGHTIFFLQKKDYSLKRFVNVMIRTNLLPVTLAYVMRTRWLLYYYMPLSTFWFTIVYATLAVGKKNNDRTWYLLVKIAASAWMVHNFITTKDLSDTLVRLFAITCKISFDGGAFFQHRVGQDQYIVYVGMLAAMFYIWSKDVLTTDHRHDRTSNLFRKAWPTLKYSAITFSALAFVYFFYWSFTNVTKEGQKWFTERQPYCSFIPILAFAVLRNAHPVLRNYFSASFAFMGRYSGEMYVMQDHLWLAGDQESILRTGLFHGNETVNGDRWKDLLLLTPLYLIVCSIIGDSTGVIAKWFVEESDEERETTSKGALEVEMGLLAEEEDQEKELCQESLSTPRWLRNAGRYQIWPTRLKHRVLLVLAAMWFLNVAYR